MLWTNAATKEKIRKQDVLECVGSLQVLNILMCYTNSYSGISLMLIRPMFVFVKRKCVDYVQTIRRNRRRKRMIKHATNRAKVTNEHVAIYNHLNDEFFTLFFHFHSHMVKTYATAFDWILIRLLYRIGKMVKECGVSSEWWMRLVIRLLKKLVEIPRKNRKRSEK